MQTLLFLSRSARRLFAAACAGLLLCAGQFAGQAAAQVSDCPLIRGVVLLSDPADVRPDGVPVPPGEVDASRVLLLTRPEAQRAIRAYLYQPLSNVMLDSLRAAIGNYYMVQNRPFVTVTVPEQDATSGAIQLVVTEAVVGEVFVDGASHFSERHYTGAVRLRPGEPINNAMLQEDLAWLNRNPYRQVTAVASASETVGATDVTLQTQERTPLSFIVGADNTGNRSTGLYRLFASVDWGNAFGRGDILSYRYTTSAETSRLQQHSASYTSFLPWRDVLTLSATFADSSTGNAGPISTNGVSNYLSLRYEHPLPRLGRIGQSVTAGYDFKSTNSDILFGGASVFAATTEINQFSLSYRASRPDENGTTAVAVSFIASPGGVTGLNTDAAFQAQQAGAEADYVYLTASLERVTQLGSRITWYGRAAVQLADGTLLPSEQVSFGGPGSNRAFQVSAATRDNGLQLYNDLRLSGVRPGLLTAVGLADEFTPLIFLDYSGGWNHDIGFGDDWVALASMGAGFEYRIAQYGVLRFTYGVPILRDGRYAPTLLPQFSGQFTF